MRLCIDMHREGDDLLVNVELPGIDPEKDLEVSVEGDLLTINGVSRRWIDQPIIAGLRS